MLEEEVDSDHRPESIAETDQIASQSEDEGNSKGDQVSSRDSTRYSGSSTPESISVASPQPMRAYPSSSASPLRELERSSDDQSRDQINFGNVYGIENGGIGRIDPTQIDPEVMQKQLVTQQLHDFHDLLLTESNNVDYRASLFKYLNQGMNVLAILMTVAAGFMSILDQSQNDIRYASGALCFASAGLRTLSDTFRFNTRAVTMKRVATSMRKLSRSVQELQSKNANSDAILRKLDKMYNNYDELVMEAFSSDMTRYRSPITVGDNYARYSRASGRSRAPIPIDYL